MKLKKVLSLVLAAIMIAAVFSACGQGNANDGTSAAPGTETTGAGSGGSSQNPVELTIWTGSWNESVLTPLIQKFEGENPGIKVKAEYLAWDGMEDKLTIALQQDNGPDIVDMAIAWTSSFVGMNKLAKLDEYIQKNNMDMSDFYEGALKTATYNNSYYALPYRTETIGLFYNKKLFQEAGLDPEKAPSTWQELAEYAKALTKGDVAGFGMCGKEAGNVTTQIYSIIMANGGKILSDDLSKAAFDSPEAVEAFKFWTDLYTKDKAVPSSVLENDNTTNRNLFAQEKVAMYMSGNYDIDPILEANPNISMGFAIVPKMKTNATQLGGWNIGMTTTCKDKEAGFKLCQFLSSTENSPIFSNTFSARKSATSDPKYSDPNLKAFMEANNYGQPIPGSPKMSQITNILYNAAQAVLIGDKTAEQAIKDAAEEANGILQ